MGLVFFWKRLWLLLNYCIKLKTPPIELKLFVAVCHLWVGCRLLLSDSLSSRSHFLVLSAGFYACSSAPGPYFSLILITTKANSQGYSIFNLALDNWAGENKETSWFNLNIFLWSPSLHYASQETSIENTFLRTGVIFDFFTVKI